MTAPSGFSRSRRLTKTDEFSSVFVFKCSVRGNFLNLMGRPGELSHPRLGVVVSKRVARRANERNYMKRVIRETFRLNQSLLAPLDIVARVHKPFEKKDFSAVREELERLFAGLKKCLERSSS